VVKKILVLFLAVALVLSIATPALAAKPITPKVLEGVFIHYEHPGKGKPPPAPEEPKVYDYYILLGPKWDLSKYPMGVSYVVNPTGAPLGAEREVKAAFEAWDAATTAELFNDNPRVDTTSWWGKLDGRNNVSWQVIAGGGIIAGTWVWYLDSDNNGRMSLGDEILETDIVFNASQKWGIDLDGEGLAYKLTNAYDVRDIATHEAGHVVGLGDLYEDKYSEITMYGYSSKGETKKISLAVGDVNGTIALYGP
jgi:hypothetical protein